MSLEQLLQQHSASLSILVLTTLVLGTLLLVVPQLLRWHQQTQQWRHEEIMLALQQGQPLPSFDDRSRFAGRTVVLVPMVAICTAGAVTCFIAAYKVESLFSVTLAIWSVAGVASLAAITGGVALMGRLAQLHLGVEDEVVPEDDDVDK